MSNGTSVPDPTPSDFELDETIGAANETAPLGGAPLGTGGPSDIPFSRGDRLGRFLVVDELGSGAMGVVVSAYDPDLDRKVAIKVLRSELSSRDLSTLGQQRLAREAQAMAKLQHPNVVTVFEVGTVRQQVFVAMEFVEGHTLTSWLKEQHRSWRDIVKVFSQAGRGLAAAHEVGLVHRDFKPDNVLVRANGIPCVADFGLASASGLPLPADASVEDLHESLPERLPLNMTLTQTGQLLGTPAYMAPEQLRRKRVSAQADQFSFCAALYEALFGKLPYAGKTIAELQANTEAGVVESPPAGTKVPDWITEALVRGLSADPADRFRDMDAVLEAINRDPTESRPRSWRLGAMALGIAALLAVVVGVLWQREQEGPCAAVADEIGSVWDDDARGAVKRAFEGTGRPDAAETFKRVDKALTAYVEAWQKMRTEACEATFTRRQQTHGLLDLQVQCLSRRREELRAVARLLGRRPDRELLSNAVQVSVSLTPLTACADTDSLLAAVPAPEDPVVRAKVEQLRRQLDQVAALNMTNTSKAFAEGTEIAHRVAAEAEATGYAPLRAEALRWVGDMQYGTRDLAGAEATFHRALMAAAEVPDDHLVAVILARLLRLMAYDQGRNSDSLALVPVAEAATVRAKDDVLRGQVVFEKAFLLYQVGRVDQSKREAERALGIAERALGPDHPDVAERTDFIGILHSRAGHFAEAVRLHERAQATMERALGPGHNKVAEVLNNLCKAYKEWGQYAKAQPVCERSIDIAVAALGADFHGVGCTRNHYADVLCGQGKYEQGIGEARTALTLLEKTVGPDHRWVAASLTALGLCLVDSNEPAAAVAPLKRSLALREKASDPIDRAKTRFAMARALQASKGDAARALSLASQALEAYAKAPAPHRREREAIEGWLTKHGAPNAARSGRASTDVRPDPG